MFVEAESIVLLILFACVFLLLLMSSLFWVLLRSAFVLSCTRVIAQFHVQINKQTPNTTHAPLVSTPVRLHRQFAVQCLTRVQYMLVADQRAIVPWTGLQNALIQNGTRGALICDGQRTQWFTSVSRKRPLTIINCHKADDTYVAVGAWRLNKLIVTALNMPYFLWIRSLYSKCAQPCNAESTHHRYTMITGTSEPCLRYALCSVCLQYDLMMTPSSPPPHP